MKGNDKIMELWLAYIGIIIMYSLKLYIIHAHGPPLMQLFINGRTGAFIYLVFITFRR